MEGYDNEYIKRIKDKAKVYLKLDEWCGDSVIKCDLSHFKGIIYHVKYERLEHLINKYHGWVEVVRDSENITAYFCARDYSILFIGEVSIETHDHIIEEYSQINGWLNKEAERKAKEEQKAQEVEEVEIYKERRRKKGPWWPWI